MYLTIKLVLVDINEIEGSTDFLVENRIGNRHACREERGKFALSDHAID